MTMMSLVSFAQSVTRTPVFLFGEAVYDEGPVESDYIKSGTVSFDPSTYTVTFDNAVIDYTVNNDYPLMIGQSKKTLTLRVVGACNVKSEETFLSADTVVIQGVNYSGRLIVTVNADREDFFIWADHNVTITECLVKATTNTPNGIITSNIAKSNPDSYLYLNSARLFLYSQTNAIYYFKDIVYNRTKLVTPDPTTVGVISKPPYFAYNGTTKSVPNLEFEQATVNDPIVFADAETEKVCVANWDTNHDNKLSYAEAAAATTLGSVFRDNDNITSFRELIYFTGLTSIDNYAFFSCEKLTNIQIPSNVESIGGYAFTNTYSLSIVNVADNNKLATIGSGAFTNSGIQVLEGADQVVSIGTRAFKNCQKLQTFDMSSTLKIIALEAFYNCPNFFPRLPSSIGNIGNYAFYGCTRMTKAQTIGEENAQVSIGEYAFAGSGMTSLTIGSKHFTLSPNFTKDAPADFVCYIDHSVYNDYKAQMNAQGANEMTGHLKPFTIIPQGYKYRTFYFDKDVQLRDPSERPRIITTYRQPTNGINQVNYMELTDGIIPANTPVLLYSFNPAVYYDIIEKNTVEVQPVKVVNYLVGTHQATTLQPSSDIENRLVWRTRTASFIPVETASAEEKHLDAGSAYLLLPKQKYSIDEFMLNIPDHSGGQQLSMKGDVDGNGVINKDDVNALVNVLFGLAVHPLKQCDMDENNTVNMADLTALILLLNQNK